MLLLPPGPPKSKERHVLIFIGRSHWDCPARVSQTSSPKICGEGLKMWGALRPTEISPAAWEFYEEEAQWIRNA